MDETSKLTEQSVRDELNRIRQLLSAKPRIEGMHVWIPLPSEPSEDDRELRLRIVGMILQRIIPHSSLRPRDEQHPSELGISMPHEVYETMIRPRYHDEPMTDRVRRLLTASGYGHLAEDIDHAEHPEVDALERQFRKRGQGGSGPAVR